MFPGTTNYGQHKPSLNVQVYVGLLEGSGGTAFQVQAIPGVIYKNWIAGLGTGLDYYKRRSVPLFLSLRRDLSIRNKQFFIGADGGLNYEWTRKTDPMDGDFKPAPFYGANIGYRFPLWDGSKSILLSFGYSYKQLREYKNIQSPCLIPPCPENIEIYRFHLNRWSFRTGFQFR